MKCLGRIGVVVLAVVGLLVVEVGSARAFDTGPHVDIISDALGAEGFRNSAIKNVQVAAWLIDMYDESISSKNWYVTHNWLPGVDQSYDKDALREANKMHFDASGGFGLLGVDLSDNRSINLQWDRLALRTRELVRIYRDNNDIDRFLMLLGITLHQVQDFYSHTNWVEDSPCGPNWLRKGQGLTPTYYDVPIQLRTEQRIYVGGTKQKDSEDSCTLRTHGSWNDGINKDTVAKGNLYERAYIGAYFASRQWVQSIKLWINDNQFWSRALSAPNIEGLSHEYVAMVDVSVYAGHWNTGTNHDPSDFFGWESDSFRADDLADAMYQYHELKTHFRSSWEEVLRVLTSTPSYEPYIMQCVQNLQRSTNFVRLEITQMHGDLDPLGDSSDFYATATIAGQQFRSGVIFGKNDYSFASTATTPYRPFTFLKAVSKTTRFDEPLTSLEIEITTGSQFGAGTDGDIWFSINENTRFLLDKDLYNDFENGDKDTYSIPLDSLIRKGMSMADIEYVNLSLEGGPSFAKDWFLKKVKVTANQKIILQVSPKRWLTNIESFWRSQTTQDLLQSSKLPVSIGLYDDDNTSVFDDFSFYGDNDHADINPMGNRRDLAFAFDHMGSESTGTRQSRGGNTHGGYDIFDETASINYRIWTVSPKVPLLSKLPCTTMVVTPIKPERTTPTTLPPKHIGKTVPTEPPQRPTTQKPVKP